MKNIRDFLSENFQFLEMKISTYLNRHVFVMNRLIPEVMLPVHDMISVKRKSAFEHAQNVQI